MVRLLEAYDQSSPKLRATLIATQGEDVIEGRVLTRSVYESVRVGFFDSGDHHFSTALYCCADEKPPTRQISSESSSIRILFSTSNLQEIGVHQLCQVNYSVSCTKLWMESSYRNPLTKEKWRDCMFQIAVLLGEASLDLLRHTKVKL
jgi:hypothetical protein